MTFHSRAAWGAKYAPARVVDRKLRSTWFLHHTVVESPADHDKCAAVMRQIEADHHAKWEYSVGYQHVVCQHGDVLEGCGWDRLGQQAEKANTYSVGVAYLGDGRKTVPRPAIVGLRERYHAANAHFGRTLTLRGHRDLKPTNCPGDRLYAEMGALLVPPTGDDDDMTARIIYADGVNEVYVTDWMTKWHVPTDDLVKELRDLKGLREEQVSAELLQSIPDISEELP